MIYICTLTRDSINPNTVFDLVQLIRRSKDYLFAVVCGIYVQQLREGSAAAVTASGASHILFIDSDMMFPTDTIDRLMGADKDIIGANYVRRVEQNKWTAVVGGQDVSSSGKKGLEEVDSIGMGVCLIKTDVFKKLPKPWFDMKFENGVYGGEDVSFCKLARENGYKIYIDHDLSQAVKHIGQVELGVHNFGFSEYSIPNIQGWMTPNEMNFLYSMAKQMDSVIELGSWKGRSTHALATGCKGTVTAIDHWRGSEGDVTLQIAAKEDIYKIFIENIKEFTNIEVKRAFAHEVCLEEPDLKADMVFIDAGHIYSEVKQDIDDWTPRARKLICGHDYSLEFPDVIRAVDEKFGKPDLVTDTLWCKYVGGQSANI